MPRRRTSRVNKTKPERRLHLKVSSPRIACFECLRFLKSAAKVLLVLGLVGAAGWGAKSGMRSFFIENDEFQLSEVDLETNGEFTEGHFAQVTGIDPTASVFAIKLREIREKLLESPGIVKAELSRRLPGTLRVKVQERIPVAWLECRPLGIVGKDPKSGLLLDENGVCFPCEFWWEEKARLLPVVLVSQAEEGDVSIGKPLRHHEARRALELIKLSKETLGEGPWSLPVVAVRNDYSLQGATSNGVLVTFGMYEHKRQLADLITLMRSVREGGEVMTSVNLIPERNIPVKTSRPGSGGFQAENRLQRDILAILKQG
ncbi:MAG: FtsQ-type POTRA domain-containing protein [Roseibacillus sp.]